jgi:hypothetical protein
MKNIWFELVTILCDTLVNGDLRGHLAAWWNVYTYRITPETRVQVSL